MSTLHNVLASGQSNHPFHCAIFRLRDGREDVSASMGIRANETKSSCMCQVRRPVQEAQGGPQRGDHAAWLLHEQPVREDRDAEQEGSGWAL